MKASSSMYEPKQSDCQYWYSPECGKVIVSEENSSFEQLNTVAFQDATENNKKLYGDIHWICLDEKTTDYIANEDGLLEEWTTGINPVVVKQFELWFGNEWDYMFSYEEGMTLDEWFASEYNTNNLSIAQGGRRIAYEYDVVYETNPNVISNSRFIETTHFIHDIEYYYESIFILGGNSNSFGYDYFIYIKSDKTTEKLPISEYENIKNK